MFAWVILAGCGGANQPSHNGAVYEVPVGPPQALAAGEAFYIPGEQMSWEVSLHGILGGEAALATGHPGKLDGRNAIVVRSQVRSAGVVEMIRKVNDDVTTWIDFGTGKPIRHLASLQFGDKFSRVETVFSDDGYVMDYQRRGRTSYKRAQNVPNAATHDGHSIIGALRGWAPEVGQRAYFYVVSGRTLWLNDIGLVARETIKTRMGTHPALRIEGIASRVTGTLEIDRRKKPRTYTVWISDDASRVPLLVEAHTEYGNVRVELVQYERPDRHIVSR
ncbi:MAG TPA: DUF3108 domain-containing protein [Kofleriaceae bacterium]|nr:DUF3108 domain-containing protein [Kofleriaceae bacterium]